MTAAAHTALVHDILAELGALPGVVLGSNACGLAKYVSREGKPYAVPYGWPAPGGPDILAVVAPHGRLVALEAKTGRARLSRDQRACHDALRAVGVVVTVVRCVEDARAALRVAYSATLPSLLPSSAGDSHGRVLAWFASFRAARARRDVLMGRGRGVSRAA